MTRPSPDAGSALAASELRDLTIKCRTTARRASDEFVSGQLRKMADEFAVMAKRLTG